jgi:hypothetical protein
MKKLVISFSGGRTSAYMTKKILDTMTNEYEIKVIFANTGFENEATLQFVHDCDTQFNFNTIWLEGVTVYEPGVGMNHKVVTFETAARKGEPFEDMVKKYGVTNVQAPQCTRNLKRYPIESYLRSIDWKIRDYDLAIGIRTDEQRRVKDDKTRNVVYPLVDWFPVEHQGNCKTCWKKSFNKLERIYHETPEHFDFFQRLEETYGNIGAEFQKYDDALPRVFFRGRTSVTQFIEIAKKNKDEMKRLPTQLDLYEDGGCSESCELYETE